ncbi:hypothetical protein, partial [Mycobacterium tuberculosis]
PAQSADIVGGALGDHQTHTIYRGAHPTD